jgi:hypothetical protein
MRRNAIVGAVVALGSLAVLATAPAAHAVKLEETDVFIEINDTDGDAGIHMFLDGEGWRKMKVYNPDGNLVLNVKAKGAIAQQGLTEFFFESAEPSFEVQPLEEFLALHPPGTYTFRGVTTEGEEITGKAKLTHHLPEAPLQVFPVDEGVDPDAAEFVWEPVADPPGGEIIGYNVVVECEGEEERVLDAFVAPTVTSLTVPPEFLEQEEFEECKWEVLAVDKSGNKTISETPFEVE